MATVTINNYEQKQVEQRMLVNQLVDNGMGSLLKGAGRIYKKRGISGLAKTAKSIGGGMARKAGGAIKTQARKTQAFAKRNPGKTVALAGAGGGLAGGAAGMKLAHGERDQGYRYGKKIK